MNTMVIYDSQYGNTKRIAQAIADTLLAFGQAQAVRVDPDRSLSFQGADQPRYSVHTQSRTSGMSSRLART